MIISNKLKLLSHSPPASDAEIESLVTRFPQAPQEYLSLCKEMSELELETDQGQYFRIWPPRTCIEMNVGYKYTDYISDAIPIGDNGGCSTLLFMNGEAGFGLYIVSLEDIDRDEAVYVSPTLTDLLENAMGAASLRGS